MSVYLAVSLVISLMVSYFVLSFSQRDVFDEIWDKIESLPENFPTYSWYLNIMLDGRHTSSARYFGALIVWRLDVYIQKKMNFLVILYN